MTIKRSKKAALQLSMNFIVSLIIAAAFFGVGILLITMLTGGSCPDDSISFAGKCIDHNDCDDTACLKADEKVCITENTKEFKKGFAEYCLYIYNTDTSLGHNFKIDFNNLAGLEHQPDKDSSYTAVSSPNTVLSVDYFDETYELPAAGREQTIFVVEDINANKGKYKLPITIKRDNADYEKEVIFIKKS